MMQKYCLYCGHAIEADDAFCPFCGQAQPATDQATQHVQTSAQPSTTVGTESNQETTTSATPNVDITPFQNGPARKYLTAYRHALGYTTPNVRYIYGFYQDFHWHFWFRAIGLLFDRYYYVTFEPDGLLFLGVSKATGHLSGKNSFFNFADITTIRWQHALMTDKLLVDAPQGKIMVSVVRHTLADPNQATNVQALAAQYGDSKAPH
ncbi:hypothetical protein FD30_GL001531 [Levilactobacillus namurensis DSM 19117]|uniref:Zinc-ribbon domain-containing protein n=2 Tax=Levilactobacillus namurensis TaxID=380393 RepID=A0A0R1K6F6_9LACO|nr:hypothetical protein [Levilactobacillus namurensis]KRK76180.1 hypothetical protein FD30_GL001531 [Levilactobacillus namurensis DSM 19117]